MLPHKQLSIVWSPSHSSPNIFQQIGLLNYPLSSSQFAAAQDSAPQVAVSFFPYPHKRCVQKFSILTLLHTKYLSMTDGLKQGHFLLCRTGRSHYFPWLSSTIQSLPIIEKRYVSLELSHPTCCILPSLPAEMS